MVILATWHGQTLTLSTKPNCLTLSLQGSGASTVFSFDGEGRLWTAMLAGISYRRGLDGKIVAKWQTGHDQRERRWLSSSETESVQENARMTASELLAELKNGELRLHPGLDSLGWSFLEKAAAFDAPRYATDVQRYHQVYQPVGILPPDQYMAVVLQVAEGCSFNTCTFCTFYKDRRFRIKSPDEFHAHMHAVKDFLGGGLSLRRTLFLGDANALVIPTPRLLPLLEMVHQHFDVELLGGLYAFLDGFSGDKKSSREYAALSKFGLKRVYIGLESGHDPLLRFLRKPGEAADAVQAVHAMKEAGVSVGVIVLLGAGGHRFAADHITDTIAALNQMNLDADDLVYFSELIESEGLEYTRDAHAAALQPLSPEERLDQGRQIEQGLQFDPLRGIPHISRYDIREFVY